MDGKRFDDAAKVIGGTRRATLTGGAALAVGGVLAAFSPRAARAAKKRPKKAYTCALPADDAITFGGGGAARLAQSFTATRSGTLKQISVEVTKQGFTEDYVVQLVKVNAGVPSESPLDVLAAATIPGAQVPVGTSTLTAKFATTQLTPGTQYAVVVSRPGSNDLELPDRTGDDCEGDMFSAVGGGAFSDLGDLDMIVTVLVVPAA
jgi:hypothetical protein